MIDPAQRRPRGDGIGVCILAGGEATRLPGKLFLDAGDVPMLVRVYRNVSPGRETWISTKGALPAEIDAALDAPMVVDRWTAARPALGLALDHERDAHAEWVFACAGDAPFVDASFVDRLAAHVDAGRERRAGARSGRAGARRDGPPDRAAGRALPPRGVRARGPAGAAGGRGRAAAGHRSPAAPKFVPVPADERALANVNTPAGLRRDPPGAGARAPVIRASA